jgi:dihydropteroate synthase
MTRDVKCDTLGCHQESACSCSDVWKVGERTLRFAQRPHIMGILNVTPDSFSDGALFLDPEKAVERALEMEEEGADSIDIGGESTRPFAPPVNEDQELRRVIPVIERLSGRLRVPISIDTYKASVAREAIRAGAVIVNDISGCTFDPGMLDVVSSSSAGLIIMHTRGAPSEMQRNTAYSALIPEIIHFLRERLTAAETCGISSQRIVVDPGIGFGKSLEGNLEILRNLDQFSVLSRPILVGTSRKTFIGTILGRESGDRAFGTAATIALAVAKGASILRVHDVRQMRDVAIMASAVMRSPAG